MTRHGALTTLTWRGAILTSALVIAGCGASNAGQGAGASGANAGGTASAQAAAPAGKPLDNFDPCSVVSDTEYAQAITAGAGDPSALGTVTVTHSAADGSNTGLPGAKACQLNYTTTDSAGRVSQGGDPVIVTFDQYSNLAQLQGNSPKAVNDYQSSGAQAFEGPGDAGVPHITKAGYLFRMSGNSDTKLLKTIALGIAARLQ
jgi:hypothetical protein